MNKTPLKKDIHLKEKLMKELEYWVYQAVNYLRVALQAEEIYESENSKKVRENIHKNSDSVYAFVHDCLIKVEGQNIKRSEMFKEYDDYCNYYERVRVKKKTFFEELTAKGFTTKRNGQGDVVYENVAITPWKENEQSVFKK